MNKVKLSKIQIEALKELRQSAGWMSAYMLGFSVATLDALYTRGLVKRAREMGAVAFPRTSIRYKINDSGISFLADLNN